MISRSDSQRRSLRSSTSPGSPDASPDSPQEGILALRGRLREIFRLVVDSYLESGEPVGSLRLSKKLDGRLSSATLRGVMSDLEDLGLLHAPHTSAGRAPTDLGLRLFVDGLMECGELNAKDRARIDSRCNSENRSFTEALNAASRTIAGLSRCAGFIVAPKHDDPLKHIEFVALDRNRALAITVSMHGNVENRFIDLPSGTPVSALQEAGNYLSARLKNRTFSEIHAEIVHEIENRRTQLNDLASAVVSAGLATWKKNSERDLGTLIVHGHGKLLEDVSKVSDLEYIRQLFSALETRRMALSLLNITEEAKGLRIFIGSENQLFGLTGCSMILSPYGEESGKVAGAVGVIGPTRIDYARIVPMVDYTAQIIGRLLGHP